jgi:hypothetical protein
MAIKKEIRENKFDDAVAELNAQEDAAREKSEKVVKNIAGKGVKTKTIIDKNGRKREVKVTEPRKTLPVYIPETLYEQFNEITTTYGISNNAAICQLIRDYVTEKKDMLAEV